MNEIQRLETLLPSHLNARVMIVRSPKSSSPLYTVKRTGRGRFELAMNSSQWSQLSFDQRNLLFWHAVHRIQAKTIARSPWDIVAMSVGISVAGLELLSQNLLSFSIALVVAGLASHHFYQRKRGEDYLRELTAADQGAIQLAMQFGYSFEEAYCSLYSALQRLLKPPTPKAAWHQYQTRLRVLEISRSPVRNSPTRMLPEFEQTEISSSHQKLIFKPFNL